MAQVFPPSTLLCRKDGIRNREVFYFYFREKRESHITTLKIKLNEFRINHPSDITLTSYIAKMFFTSCSSLICLTPFEWSFPNRGKYRANKV